MHIFKACSASSADVGTHLLEADVLGVLAEASAAELESVLADDPVVAATHAAVGWMRGKRRAR